MSPRIRLAAGIVALSLSAAACRPAPEAPSAPVPAAPDPDAELERRYAWLSGMILGGGQSEQEIVDALAFDSISLERSACYGSCPVYQVVLRRDLSATYHGERNVERTGAWHGGVYVFDYGRLSYMVERLGVMAMDSSYAQPVTDMATATLRIWPRGAAAPKVVSDYGEAGPPELWAVIQLVDAIATRIRWTRSRPAP